MKLIGNSGTSSDANGIKKAEINDVGKKFKVMEPILLEIYDELKDRLKDVNDATRSLKEECETLNVHKDIADDDVVDYLEVRQQLLLSYCINMTYYAYLKTLGNSIEHHPVTRQLAEQRYIIEKMRPLDAKLKYQIDRLLTYASLDEKEMKNVSLRPNLAAMLDDDDDDNDDDDDDNSNNGENEPVGGSDDEYNKVNSKSKQIYKAPKLAAMPYQEAESAIDRREKQMLKKKKKLRNSEILETLREEFGTKPEQSSSSGIGSFTTGEQRKLKAEAEERLRFEEDRFIRTSLSRKEKKDIRKRSREADNIDNFDSLGDVDDFQELADMASRNNKRADLKSSNKGSSSKLVDTSHSLTKALNVFKKKKV